MSDSMIRSTHTRHTSTLRHYNLSIDHSLRVMHFVHYWIVFVILFMFDCCCFDCINSLHCLWLTSGNSNRVWRTRNNKYHYLPRATAQLTNKNNHQFHFGLFVALSIFTVNDVCNAFDYCSWLLQLLVVEFDLIAHFCYCLHSLLPFQQMICILSVCNVIRFLFTLSLNFSFFFIPWVLIAIRKSVHS